MSTLKVLVCTWGAPWDWRPARYILEQESGQHASVESVTTASLLVDYVKPDIVLIIVLDTLAARVLERLTTDYSEVIKNVEDSVKKFLLDNVRVLDREVKIIVAPGIGRFLCEKMPDFKMEFIGSMFDFYGIILYEVSRQIIEKISNKESVEIHLDLSHGINYMPALTYKAVRTIASILALSRNVRLCVYNSEPYPYKLKLAEPPELRIHVIEAENVKPQLSALERLRSTECIKALCSGVEDLRRSFAEYCKGLIVSLAESQRIHVSDLCVCLVNSLILGLPLLLVLSWKLLEESKPSQPEGLIEQAYSIWRKGIIVEKTDNYLRVVRRLTLTSVFIGHVYAWLVKKSIESVMRSIKIEDKPSSNVAFSVKLSDIDVMREQVFCRISEIHDVFISREIWELRNTIETASQKDKFMPYINLVLSRKHVGKFDIRNFIAHSGLLYQVVAVCPREQVEKSEIGYLIEAKDVDGESVITLSQIVESLIKRG